MDLTPQTLRDVEFREKLRGYHPDDVDDFLEAAAVALEGVLGRLQTAERIAAAVGDDAPAAVAEAQPAEVFLPPPDVSDDTLKRTLLLAQRTADAAVADAEESARKVLEAATSEANRIMAEAEAKVATATREARARTESAVADLEQRKIGLEREVAALQSWATQQRDRLRDVLADQMRALDIWLATSGTPRPLGGRAALAARVERETAPPPPIDAPAPAASGAQPPEAGAEGIEEELADSDTDTDGGTNTDGGTGLTGRLFRRQ